MAKKTDQATIIIFDVGRNVAKAEEKEKSFFETAKECTSRIIERKILSQGKNFLGVILLGSKKSEHDFKHIEISVPLQLPTWQMIRDLPQTATKYKGNWFDALLVAATHFRNEMINLKISSKKIILMTNFEAASHLGNDDIEPALNGFKEEGLEVDIIGPDLYDDNNKNQDILLARQFVEATGGATASFEYTMRYLLFHKKKVVNPMPWNVDLNIGPNIKIPVSSYIRLKDEPIIKKWMKAVKDPVTNTASTSEGIKRDKIHINTENQEKIDFNEVIKGYQYGGQVIPLSDYEKSMLYNSGPKSLSVYGFTSSKNITWQCLNGDGLSYVFGRKGDKKAQQAIRCLVQCLSELDLVAIVRRVYNNGNACRMYALMPLIDNNNYICLSMVGICFKDDIKNMAFPPTNLKKYECTVDQVNAFKDLIRAMDLTKAYEESEFDDTEAFPIAEMVSPSAQYVLDCIAFRAMNPNKPLPPPRDDILMLFKVPPQIEKLSKEPLENLKKLFVLNKVEVKKRERKSKPLYNSDSTDQDINMGNESVDDMPKIQINITKKSDEIQKIGTLDPINDFRTLKGEGKNLNDLTSQLTEIIENMVFSNLDGNYTKALNTMDFLRRECVESNPILYNDWLKKFRLELVTCNKKSVVDMIVEKQLNYITDNENSLSNYKSDAMEDDSQLYDNDTEPALTGVTISSEVNDLFDNM